MHLWAKKLVILDKLDLHRHKMVEAHSIAGKMSSETFYLLQASYKSICENHYEKCPT